MEIHKGHTSARCCWAVGIWNWKRPNLYVCGLALILFLAGVNLAAQTTSTIEGIVKDKQGLAVAGAQVRVTSSALAIDRVTTTEADGAYRIATLPPGVYEVKATKEGFQSEVLKNIEVTLNRIFELDIAMQVGSLSQTVEVDSATPLLETSASSSGTTITPQQIEDMPINGRNYLDLLQLVPGVSLNRQADPAGDNATPILGERGGNALFLIDGLPNKDSFNGGPSAQFNQDSILEFQVVTGGYKAEFGHASGGIINVVTRGGTNAWHGGVSAFFRNSVFDSNDIPTATSGAPFLNRWDPTAYFGGPIVKDKVFFFGSVERIQESRDLNFTFNPNLPASLIAFETPFNKHSLTYETRGRFKLDESLGRHHLTEQLNYTNTHITDYLPLTASINLPDTRENLDGRTLMLGLSDLWTIGDTSNPWVVNSYFQYRADPQRTSPAHPEAGVPNNLFNLFDTYTSGDEFGNLGQASFGPGYNSFSFYQKYISLGSNVSKQYGRHNIKFGWDFQNSKVDGAEPNNFFTQLFATVDDFNTFGPINSGINLITLQAGPTPQDNLVRIRNNYNGLFVQDDWKLTSKVTVNAGLRWDYDSQFPNKTDFSPRVGVAWALTPKTVVNASFGVFYDQFREGVARDIPGFGGANIQRERLLSFPRLFYGNPTTLTSLFQTLGRPTVCVANAMTEAQVQAANAKCPNGLGSTLYGIDFLNNVVAPGHAPIPANTAVNMGNIQALSGFTPDQFLAAADAAIANIAGTDANFPAVPADYWSWDPFGNLTTIGGILGTAGQVPISVDPGFKVPHTFNYHAGIQHELGSGMVITFDFYHKDIEDITTVRATNLAFEARMPDTPGELVPGTGPKRIESYGPWGAGTYNGFTIGFQKRFSHNFTIQANYTFVHANDDVINSTLASEIQNGEGVNFLAIAGLSDSFVGRVPLVTDSVTGQTNATGPFINSNLNPVPKAGTFYNGAVLDKGPSDLALNHTFLTHGIWQLPWKMELSGIFRAQSGFHYSVSPFAGGSDFDGDGLFNGAGLHFDGQGALYARNSQTGPAFVNVDMRFAKRFNIGERVKAQVMFEMFNLLNRSNAAAVNGLEPTCPNNPPNISPLGPQSCNVFQSQGSTPGIGLVQQYLPGREGQIGVRFEF